MEITKEEYEEYTDSNCGICTECEDITCGGVEPDAEGYECEACGAMAVMGIEQALLTGDITISDD